MENLPIVRELTAEEVQIVSGAIDWGQVGAGIGMFAVASAIAVTAPVGVAAATALATGAFASGFISGDGLFNDGELVQQGVDSFNSWRDTWFQSTWDEYWGS